MSRELKTQELKPGAILQYPSDSSEKYKTGSWRTFRPVYDKKKCIQCLQCVYYCPENCILLKNGRRDKANLDFCKGCGICAKICPAKAIKMIEDKE